MPAQPVGHDRLQDRPDHGEGGDSRSTARDHADDGEQHGVRHDVLDRHERRRRAGCSSADEPQRLRRVLAEAGVVAAADERQDGEHGEARRRVPSSAPLERVEVEASSR